METTPILIRTLEQKLIALHQESKSKKVLIGFEKEGKAVKMGGNAPILANALGTMGIRSTCVGSMGTFNDYNWCRIKQVAGLTQLRELFLTTDVIALVDWANIRHAEDIWHGVLEDIIKASGRRDFKFFFDLCDPSKKTPYAIDEILDLISSFSFYGKVTLGLNKNEAMAIWSALTGITQTGSIEDAGKFIHYALDIDRLLIHPIDKTIVYQKRETIELSGRIVSMPKIQTGGGDNLNAGYIFGLINGLSLEESIIMGMAASGSYIQEGKSATLPDIQRYLAVWRSELESALHTKTTHQVAQLI